MLVCAKDINLKRECQSHCKLLKQFLTLQFRDDKNRHNLFKHVFHSVLLALICNEPLTKKHIWFDYACLRAISEVVTTEHLSGS